jgi:hypothetical protein
MVVQDTLTGALHEVDDGQFHETEVAEPEPMGETVYDGLGNPVGFFGRFFGRARRRRRAAAPPPPPPAPPAPPDPGLPPEAPPPDESAVGELYDGFGNPVGLFPFLRPPIPRLPIPLPRLNLGFGRRRVWSPNLRRFVSMVWNPTQRRWVNAGPVPPAAGGAVGPGLARRFRIPPGWMRPLGPVTGANRLYLRCSMWPGPSGLLPMGAGQPGAPGMPGMGRRRRRYRRSRR